MKKITFAALAVPLMWVLLLLLLLSNNKLYAQEQQVLSGVVKDANGMPLEGVTVWQKDTNNGTQTNNQGFYTLQMVPQTAVTFEYLGYKTQTLVATGKILNVTLITDDDVLDEVVINAGYYSVKDKERTGSISKITSKEISQQPVANPLAAMQGRMAGVNITQSSGTPGGGFDIQIRGRNSLRTEGNAPLYIVDGVPYASQSASDVNLSGTLFGGNVSPLNSINPNDIESIEVLKDADATAIYGSRGSNGVVLITTKKGTSDKTTFSLQSSSSVSTVAKYMDLMSTKEYLKMRRDAFANDGITDLPSNAYDVNGTWDENRYTDWQKEFIGGKAISQNTQFSMGGGSGKTNYLFSASHRQDGTVFPGDFGYKRTNFMLSVNHQSKDERFNFQAMVQKNNQKNNLMSSDMTSQIYLSPNAPALYDEEGNLNWENNTFTNPLAKLNSVYLSNTEDLMLQLNTDFKLSKDLKLNISSGLSSYDLQELKTSPSTLYNPSYGFTSEQSTLQTTTFKRENWIIEPKLFWKKNKENRSWDVLLGATIEERKQSKISLSASNFSSNDFIFNAANAVKQTVLNDSETLYRYLAAYARVNYVHEDRYILNLTGRRDGSSRFGANNRFANFGAIGAAWLFSREKFFENKGWLNFGKLRASYGIAGSDLIGDYQYLQTYGISYYAYDNVIGLEPVRLYNPDFSWENNKKLEAASELEFFNGRLASTISWYRNRSSNQLVGIPLPSTTGFTSVQANLSATVENSGWEFTLRTSNIETKNFQWSTSLNLSIPKNKLISFPNLQESTYANRYEVGQPITMRKMYKYLGIDKETGLYQVYDANKDGKIDIDDRIVSVNTGAAYFGGVSNHFQYKNWSFDFLWQFVKQKSISPVAYLALPGMNSNLPSNLGDYFSDDNPNAVYQRPTTGMDFNAIQANEYFKQSDGVVVDGSYIKLRSVQLYYTLKPKVLKNVTAGFFVQGQNLLTITKFWGNDPEVLAGYLPSLRTFSLGINLNF